MVRKNKKESGKDNRKLTTIITSLTVITILVIIAVVKHNSKRGGEILARVNGKNFYESQITERLDRVFASIPQERRPQIRDIPQTAIQTLIMDIAAEEELNRRVKKSGVKNSAEVKDKVQSYEQQITRELFLEKAAKESITDQQIQEKYELLARELGGKEEAHIKHILVKTEREARRAVRKLYSQSFEQTAKDMSIDKATAVRGGDLGYVLPEHLVKEFSDVAFGLKKGSISKPVKTQFGWHIIKLEDKRPAQAAPLASIKDQIVKELSKQAMQEYIANLTQEITIEIIDRNQNQNDQNASSSEEGIEASQEQ